MKKVNAENRNEWRDWLSANHDKENEIWLVFNKKGSGIESIRYEDSVEEALCFGWIDSLIKKIDDKQYVRKFTPRKENSKWSELNIKRVDKVIKSGLMSRHGMRLVEAAMKNGNWDNPVKKPVLEFKLQSAFINALELNLKAKETFEKLAPTYQKQYIGWIEVAKREETREKMIKESISLLEQGKKLGLK